MSASKNKPEEANVGPEGEEEQKLQKPQGPEQEEKKEPRQEPEETLGNEIETAGGTVRIAEEVIAQIATQALLSVEGVQPASPGIVANLRLGKKTSGGVRISLDEGNPPSVTVEAYVTVQYGIRIPDVAWDVQESIKKKLEEYTGYNVKSVNVYVQGVFFEKERAEEKEAATGQDTEAGEPDQG